MQLLLFPEHDKQLELHVVQINVVVSGYVPAGHPVDMTQELVTVFKKYWVGLLEQAEQLVELPKHAVQAKLHN